MPEDQKKQPSQGSPFEIVTTSKPKKFNARSLIIVLIAVVFLGVSVFLGVYLVGQRTNVEQKAAPATSMYVSPGSQTKNAGENFIFSVKMDTSANVVTGVDVRLSFDPSAIQILSLQQGSGLTGLDQTISNTYDNLAGTVSYAVFTLNGNNAVNGSGVEVLKVSAIVKGSAIAGSYDINFDPATAASASQEGQNVLVSKNKGILVVGALATALPTVSPSPTPTASPTGTGLVVPSPTATAKPSASPTMSPSPAPTSTDAANSCGGTCGSNNNCQSNFMCFTEGGNTQGVCRNPNCPSSSTCGCATSSPTPTASSQATTRTPQSSPLAIPVSGTGWTTVAGVGIGLFVIIASIAIAI